MAHRRYVSAFLALGLLRSALTRSSRARPWRAKPTLRHSVAAQRYSVALSLDAPERDTKTGGETDHCQRTHLQKQRPITISSSAKCELVQVATGHELKSVIHVSRKAD